MAQSPWGSAPTSGSEMIVTTTNAVEGRPAQHYHGIVTGEHWRERRRVGRVAVDGSVNTATSFDGISGAGNNVRGVAWNMDGGWAAQ